MKVIYGFHRRMGRATSGRITTRHRGGGSKRRYRLVSFRYDKRDIPGRIEAIEYDPNRTCRIARVVFRDGERRYILAWQGALAKADVLISKNASPAPGHALPLGAMPVGTPVYNIETHPGKGGVLVRSAGANAEILSHDAGLTTLRMPSKEIRRVPENAWAWVGAISGEDHYLRVGEKAGRTRWRGRRPRVRGSAMNPVDHPLGGGEGKASAGMKRPKNKWGKGIRGVKTRNKKKYSKKYIISRRRK